MLVTEVEEQQIMIFIYEMKTRWGYGGVSVSKSPAAPALRPKLSLALT